MKKWILIQPCKGAPIQVWEFIDDIREAMKYWYVRQAIEKYGADKVMPIAMNDVGGYHPHKPDEKDVVAVIESVEKPNISVFRQYPINDERFVTGWLSPDCTTFSCGYMGHIGLAMKIVEELFNEPQNVTADDFLLEHGWVKVMNEKWLGCLDQMNDSQVEFLERKGWRCY